ncbi:G-patch domain [Sesbania bispinosa]|nr:G-patch domain [Sesbania bispinosa]
MDKMSESMRIMEKQNAERTSTVKQMTQMFEAMQKSAEKRSMVDTTETAATPDYPPGFTQDPPEVQWPLHGLSPNYTPPIVNNASDQTAKPQGSDAKVADSQITPPQGSATNVVGVTTTPSAQQVFNSVTPSSQEKGSAAAILGVTPAQNSGGGETPLRVIFKELCKAGWVNGNIAGDDMCGLHSDTDHTIEDCEEFKRMLQDMMDRKLVQIGCGGNIVDVSVIDYSASTSPKPLVVHYTRNAAVRTTNRPIPITIQVPTSFPYKDNKAVPWRYDVEVLVGDRQVGETNVDTPNVTNIAGVGGMTRSGRIYTPDEFKTTQSSEVIKEKEKGNEVTSQKEITEETRKGNAEADYFHSKLSRLPMQPYEKPITESQPSDALMMVARVMLESGYQYGRGLGRYEQGVSQLPDFVRKQDKFGLGYKSSNADVKMFVEEKEEKRLARVGGREPRTGGVSICDIRESFISAGFEHSNLIAAAERHTQENVNNNWVRVGPPDAKLPNWEIVELPVIFNFK